MKPSTAHFAPVIAVVIAQQAAGLVPTKRPLSYVIDYTERYVRHPEAIERFGGCPPDILHVGIAVPICHRWGPIVQMGYLREVGGLWKGIRRLTATQVRERIKLLKAFTARMHAAGVPMVMPYISINQAGGDHQTRKGFWEFYDHWEEYSEWLGPRPKTDPNTWSAVKRDGSHRTFVWPRWAPLRRYSMCPNNAEWMQFQRQVVRLIAQVGYDGVFIDNANRLEDCYCPGCVRRFADAVRSGHWSADWLRRAHGIKDVSKLDLMNAPADLAQRLWIESQRDYFAELRRVGREARGGPFWLFPNQAKSYNAYSWLTVGEACGINMFELNARFAAGVLLPRVMIPGLPFLERHRVRTHIAMLSYMLHAKSRPLILNWCDGALAELGMAEVAAFSGGGAASGGEGDAFTRYARFFREKAHLYEGLRPYAHVGVCLPYWGGRPASWVSPPSSPEAIDVLTTRHVLAAVVLDRDLSTSVLGRHQAIVLEGHAYTMTRQQLEALRAYATRGGRVAVAPGATINGHRAAQVLRGVKTVPWPADDGALGVTPVVPPEAAFDAVRLAAYVPAPGSQPRLVLHVVNYDVPLPGREHPVSPVAGLTIDLRLPAGWKGVSKVEPASPDPGQLARPTWKVTGQRLRIRLPKLRIYQVLDLTGQVGK